MPGNLCCFSIVTCSHSNLSQFLIQKAIIFRQIEGSNLRQIALLLILYKFAFENSLSLITFCIFELVEIKTKPTIQIVTLLANLIFAIFQKRITKIFKSLIYYFKTIDKHEEKSDVGNNILPSEVFIQIIYIDVNNS